MDAYLFSTLYDYNYWANHRIVAAAGALSEAEFISEAPGSYGSVRGTLAHTMGVEWLWYQRCHGISPEALPPVSDFPSVAVLRARWDEEERHMREYVAGLTDAGLERRVTYRNMRGLEYTMPVWQILVHVVNHGTQHRSEAAVMLTEFGRSPGDMDLTVYLREQS